MISQTPTRVRLTAAAILAGTFVGGLALGFALDRGVVQARSPEVGTLDRGRAEPGAPPNDWIIDRLEMGADQRARVDSVLAHYGGQMSQLQREFRPQFQAMVDSANRALREVLTAEQVVTYDSLETELARRRGRGNLPGRR